MTNTSPFDDVELPAPGLWNILSDRASIELSVRRVIGPTMRARIRLKQGMIAIADAPTHSSAHLSLDAASLRTGMAALDRYLHDEVLNTRRYATIPVRIGSIEHRGGSQWRADGWITVGGVSTALELDVTYEGIGDGGSTATFRATAHLPLADILPARHTLHSRFLAGRLLRIAIEVHAEPMRTGNAAHRSGRRTAMSVQVR
jgi:polyisoprenoid-binding protein YceI